MKRLPDDLPPRLIDNAAGESDSEAAGLLKRFDRHAPQMPPEEAVWNRTLARLVREGRRQRLRLVFATACGVVLGAAGTQAFLALRGDPARMAAHVQSGREVARGAGDARAPGSAPQVGSSPPLGVAGAAAARSPRSPTPAQPDPRLGEAGRVAGAAAARPPRSPTPADPVPIPREAGRGSGIGDGAAAVASPALDPQRLRLSANATALPHGPSELIDEAEVVLSDDGTAWARAEPRAAVVDLDAGRISLHVEKRTTDAERRFDVRAGDYRFTVLGTRFEVSRLEDVVRLSVSEGRVGVFRGERNLTTVAAGGEWSSETAEAAAPGAGATVAAASPSALGAPSQPWQPFLPPPSTTSPPPIEPPSVPSSPPAPPTVALPARVRTAPASSCVLGARGDVRQLLNCYLNQARGSDLTAEVALYEAARLRRDNLTDLPGALDLLREHRRRFPSGTLTYEVRLSMAELLPKLARYREALTDIDWLLDAQTGGERRGELLLLRGHVLREGFANWSGAERTYAQAVEAHGGDGRAADPASFWRAVCLESLGRKDEARRAYAAYLARPRPSLREQAELRLRALEREHSNRGAAQSR